MKSETLFHIKSNNAQSLAYCELLDGSRTICMVNHVDLNFSCPKNAFLEVIRFFLDVFFLAKSNLALFAPCGEPSVFALVKSSLDCTL